jgi:hypothetical protein
MMSSSEIYTTIAAPSEGLYKEKGSKFLAFAYPFPQKTNQNLLQTSGKSSLMPAIIVMRTAGPR